MSAVLPSEILSPCDESLLLELLTKSSVDLQEEIVSVERHRIKVQKKIKCFLFAIFSPYSFFVLLYYNTSKLKNQAKSKKDKLTREKNKYKRLITEVVTPRMSEMLECLRDTYGEDVFRQFEQMIKENT